MSEQPWWWWVANIVGTLSFIAVVADVIIEKRKIPKHIIVLANIAFVLGVAVGLREFGTIGHAIGFACVFTFVILISWASATAFHYSSNGCKNKRQDEKRGKTTTGGPYKAD